MATIKQIKEQQQAIKAIYKITNAMQLVSTAKSQRSIRELNSYFLYYKEAELIVDKIVSGSKHDEKLEGVYWVILMSDLGLAGSYNSKLIKIILEQVQSKDKILVIGNKGKTIFSKLRNQIEIVSLESLHQYGGLSNIQIKIQSAYRDEHLKVKAIFTKFISPLEFEPRIKQVLPIESFNLSDDIQKTNLALTEFEPSKELLLKEIEEIYIQSIVQNFYREAKASENSARRVAMENATRNGEDLLRNLNIVYNRTRQSKITQEISEIIGGAEALK